MNAQLQPDAIRHAVKARPPHDIAFTPDLMDQMVAGLLWMSLDLPRDVSRREMEMLAHQLVLRIRAGFDNAALEREFTLLQLEQFCRPQNHAAIREVIRRAVNTVYGS